MTGANQSVNRAGRARVSGEHFTHRYLWMVAGTLRERAPDKEVGEAHLLLAASLFVYLAVESFLNYVGERLCPVEWKHERTFFNRGDKYQGTLGKLRLLVERSGVAFDRGARPYQTITELDRRRDVLAHARHETFEREVECRTEVIPHADPEMYSFANPDFVARAFEDAEKLCDAIEVGAQQKLGEFGQLTPYAFRGAISVQVGSMLEMPSEKPQRT